MEEAFVTRHMANCDIHDTTVYFPKIITGHPYIDQSAKKDEQLDDLCVNCSARTTVEPVDV